MSKYIPYFEPKVGKEEASEVAQCLDSGWLTTGPKAEKLEEEISTFVGAKHAIAVNSGTAALYLALDAIGVDENDEVITTPYTFSSTAEVIQLIGATPVFADVRPRCFNIDPSKAKKKISKDTKAIIAVDIAGFPCDLKELKHICNKNNIHLIEDAAHAFPAKYNGSYVGSISDITCFSFYANKTITTGEGGMVLTNNYNIAREIRLKSLHGIDKDCSPKSVANESWSYDIQRLGYKFNMPDVCAAIGLRQMKKATNMHKKRSEIAKVYYNHLPKEELELPVRGCELGDDIYGNYTSDTVSSNHLYMIRLKRNNNASLCRNEFINKLEEEGVGTSVHYIPLHLHSLYRKKFGFEKYSYPISYKQFEKEVSIPISNNMKVEDAYKVVDRIKNVLCK